MWLVKAVGPIHGQSYFTFPLEQKKTYTLGRDKSCDIRFESRKVRPVEGTIEVKDWDPTKGQTPPQLRWLSAPKKSGGYGTYKVLLPVEEDLAGSRDRDDYEATGHSEQPGCHLHDHVGMGIEITDDAWFSCVWIPLSIQNTQMKDQTDEVRAFLSNYCISQTAEFDTVNLPTCVLSTAYKANPDCNYAVCYGVRILLPAYLDALMAKCAASWKLVADSQDSFDMPDEEDPQFQPPLDPSLANARMDVNSWLPDKNRRHLFAGWQILGLKGSRMPAEKRYLTAMGAEYTDIDVITNPPLTLTDFAERIRPWLEEVDSRTSRESALVVHFGTVKPDLVKKGVDFTAVIAETCRRSDVILASGGICWGAVRTGGVLEYIEEIAGPRQDRLPSRVPDTVPPASSAALPPPSLPLSQESPPLQQAMVIPSTYPEEAENAPPAAVGGLRRRVQIEPPETQASANVEIPATQSARKPLKRRAGRAPETFAPIAEVSIEMSPPLQSQASFLPSSIPLPPPQSSFVPDGIPPESKLSARNPSSSTSRLKRRVGAPPQQSLETAVQTAESVEKEMQEEETAAEIRKLYEQTKAERTSAQLPPAKRARVHRAGTVESHASRSRESTVEPLSRSSRTRNRTATDAATGENGMDLDEVQEIEEEDFVQRTLREAAKAKKEGRAQATPAPKRASHRNNGNNRSPSEAQEEVEHRSPVKKPRALPKDASQTTRDESFLQAINKATKAKKAVDELDKDFAQLKLPTKGGRAKAVEVKPWEDHPDWAIVNDFDDDMRGNFIQIIKKDLFRKDHPKEIQTVDDGRPNFKKFKKKNIVRREPLHLVLAGPATDEAEPAKPFWATQRPSGKGQKGRARDVHDMSDDEESELPLLPTARPKKRLLTEDDDDEMPPPSNTARLRRTQKDVSSIPETPQASQSARPSRAASVTSEASTADTRSTAATRQPAIRVAASSRASTRAKQPIVLEDSDEDDTPVFASTTGRSRAGASAKTDSASAAEDVLGSALSKATKSTRATPATLGRRQVIVADDDDEMVFKGPKKRRVR